MDCLVERGITDCFAVVGGGAMFIDNALLHCEKIIKYFNHHEQACAMAAESYARSTGKIALVSVTSGPGGTNTLTGVMGAYVDSIPMIVISGQVRYAVSVPKTGLRLRTRGIQEFNIVDTVKTMTKYAKLVTNPLDIKMEINKALDIALSGRRGPVWLDIPQDVQSAIVEENELTLCVKKKDNYTFDTKDFYNRIANSKRPIFLIGGGVVSTNSRDLVRRLISKIRIPSVCSFNGTDVIYRKNELFFGPVGPCGQRSANLIIQNSDLIICLGCSLGFSVTGFARNNFAPNSRIIAIDVDEEEIKKPGNEYEKVYSCDLQFALNEIISSGLSFDANHNWFRYCTKLKTIFSPFEALAEKKNHERVCSYAFWKVFYDLAPDDAILVLGNNTAITSALQIGNLTKNQHIYANHNCGSMGYDIPAAIGVAIATKQEVILATGDGSIMMNLQELQTIHHYGVPVKILVFENNGYNAIRQTSKNFFNGELIGCTPETGVSFPSFEDVATTFGLDYIICKNNSEIESSLLSFFKSKKSILMEISQLLDDPIIPKVMSRVDENGILSSPALHDMYPFLSIEELDDLMYKDDK